MKSKKLRIILPLVILCVVAVGYVTTIGIGTVSAFGWGDISLICPVGALGVMLAEKLVIPRAVISLVIVAVLVFLFGRAFCSWICPVPVVSKLCGVFKGKKATEEKSKNVDVEIHEKEDIPKLSESEKALLIGCSTSCTRRRSSIDSRHFVLGGSLLSAAIFGFPVFCLICPIGLSFATVLLVMRLFGAGDVSWAVLAVPALLLIEVVIFRKWCSTFCPLSALMSLMAKGNRTFRPNVNDAVCIEASKGVECGRCAKACPESINPRHPEIGASWSECTRCGECVDACPARALSISILPKATESRQVVEEKETL